MHPSMYHELAKIKIAEELQYAERQRLARLAVTDRPRPIDMVKLGGSIRRLLLGGFGARGATNPPSATAAKAGA